MKLKERILKWVNEYDNELVQINHIKQTNISFRKTSYRENYYFVCGGWGSPYTMKRFLEIAENKLYDSFKHRHGTFHFIKDNKIIN